MHAWWRGRRARTRIPHDTAVQILRYSCIVRAFIEQTSVGHLTVCLCAPRMSFTFYRFRKKEKAEAHLKQLEFALSTGHLEPDPPKQQMIPVLPRVAKPELMLDGRPMVQTNRVDVLC